MESPLLCGNLGLSRHGNFRDQCKTDVSFCMFLLTWLAGFCGCRNVWEFRIFSVQRGRRPSCRHPRSSHRHLAKLPTFESKRAKRDWGRKRNAIWIRCKYECIVYIWKQTYTKATTLHWTVTKEVNCFWRLKRVEKWTNQGQLWSKPGQPAAWLESIGWFCGWLPLWAARF